VQGKIGPFNTARGLAFRKDLARIMRKHGVHQITSMPDIEYDCVVWILGDAWKELAKFHSFTVSLRRGRRAPSVPLPAPDESVHGYTNGWEQKDES
jgi:hypothetical protein